MDAKTIELELLHALAHEEDSSAPLLRGVIQLLSRAAGKRGGVANCFWIARDKDAQPNQSHFLLVADAWLVRDPTKPNWSDEVANKIDGHSTQVQSCLVARIVDKNEQEVTLGWYCLCNQPLSLSAEQHHAFELALGRSLANFLNDCMIQSVRPTMEELRDDLTNVSEQTLKLPTFAKAFKRASDAIGKALIGEPLCIIGYGLKAWRQQRVGQVRPLPEHYWYNCDEAKFDDCLKGRIIEECVRSVAKPKDELPLPCISEPQAVDIESNHPLAQLVTGIGIQVRAYTLSLFLDDADDADPEFSFPFLCILHLSSPGHGLSHEQSNSILFFLKALSQVVQMLDILEIAEAEEENAKKLPSIEDPVELAQEVVQFLARTFCATEVAVCERQGNFLAVLAETHVPRDDVPPLYIPDETRGLVCEVARTNRSCYSKDVLTDPNYLAVVPETRTQFTVPLVWRTANVGVMLVGLGVVHGLSNHDQDFISSLAVRCAESISALQRDAERRTILHMLKDNLPIVRSQLDKVTRKAPREFAASLETAGSLVRHCLVFIEDYTRTENRRSQTESIDLESIVKECLEEDWIRQLIESAHVSVSITKVNPQLNTIVETDRQALSLAIRHIVMNGVDAMCEKGNTATESRHMRQGGAGEPASMDAHSQRGDRRMNLTITIENEDVWNEPLHSAIPFGVVRIRDEGPGIPISLQQDLFLFGFTTKSSHFGGGLSIAKRAMESFGGRITFESEVGHGAAFSLYVPIATKS